MEEALGSRQCSAVKRLSGGGRSWVGEGCWNVWLVGVRAAEEMRLRLRRVCVTGCRGVPGRLKGYCGLPGPNGSGRGLGKAVHVTDRQSVFGERCRSALVPSQG